MRKLFLLIGAIIFIASCSVNGDELHTEELSPVDLVSNIDGCIVHSYELGEAGEVEIRNYKDEVVIRVNTKGNVSLNQINFHFAEDLNGFPTNKKGEFIVGQMEFRNRYPQGTFFEEFRIPLSSLSDSFYTAMLIEYGSGRNKKSIWVGDEYFTGADWKYFSYVVSPFPYYAGTDKYREITLSEARALESWNQVRGVYAAMLDEGVDRSQWHAYSPSIWDIINDFNDPNRESQLGDYITTYTLGTGDCSDSAVLTLRIIED